MDLIIKTTAHKLALKFQDDSEIPERFKNQGNKTRNTVKKDSTIEKNFQTLVDTWYNTIEKILIEAKNREQAWRFINIKPLVKETEIKTVTKCQDFKDFTDILIKRRDYDNCDTNELGNLSKLHSAFQKEIGRVIGDPLS